MTVPNSIDGQSILITGGTGSFGRALTKVLLDNYKPARLAILSRDELKQFEMPIPSPIACKPHSSTLCGGKNYDVPAISGG